MGLVVTDRILRLTVILRAYPIIGTVIVAHGAAIENQLAHPLPFSSWFAPQRPIGSEAGSMCINDLLLLRLRWNANRIPVITKAQLTDVIFFYTVSSGEDRAGLT